MKKEADPRFEEFWKAYPRKVAKAKARDKWGTKVKPGEGEAVILDVERRVKTGEWQKGSPFIPHPATYLNQERWRDEGEPEAPPAEEFRPTPEALAQAILADQRRNHEIWEKTRYGNPPRRDTYDQILARLRGGAA